MWFITRGLCSAWLNHVLYSLDQNGPESMQYCCLSKSDPELAAPEPVPHLKGAPLVVLHLVAKHMITIQKFTLIVPIQFYFKNVPIPFDWFWPGPPTDSAGSRSY